MRASPAGITAEMERVTLLVSPMVWAICSPMEKLALSSAPQTSFTPVSATALVLSFRASETETLFATDTVPETVVGSLEEPLLMTAPLSPLPQPCETVLTVPRSDTSGSADSNHWPAKGPESGETWQAPGRSRQRLVECTVARASSCDQR